MVLESSRELKDTENSPTDDRRSRQIHSARLEFETYRVPEQGGELRRSQDVDLRDWVRMDASSTDSKNQQSKVESKEKLLAPQNLS